MSEQIEKNGSNGHTAPNNRANPSHQQGSVNPQKLPTNESQELSLLKGLLSESELKVKKLTEELAKLKSSTSWKITAPIRRGAEFLRRARGYSKRQKVPLLTLIKNREWKLLLPTKDKPSYFLFPRDPLYAAWIRKYESLLAVEPPSKLEFEPLISIVLPVYNPPEKFLRDAIESVRAQTYKNWELCIADDASTLPHVRKVLSEFESLDPKIKIILRESNGHISEASNSALELAKGEYVALLDHDDLLAPHALYEMAKAMQEIRPDLIYSNEDKIDSKRRRSEPTFKASWSPDYFESFMYIGHLSLYRKELVDKVGGFRKGLEGSQDYDLALRVSEISRNIIHVPKILYHWRKHAESVAGNIEAKPYAFRAAERALGDALQRRGETGEIRHTTLSGVYRAKYQIPPESAVSVFLYCKREIDVEFAIERFRLKTGFEKLDFAVGCVHASRSDSTTINSKERVYYSAEFRDRTKFWRKALENANGDYVLLVDCDLLPVKDSWLEELLSLAARNSVGAAGPKLTYPDGKVFGAGYNLLNGTVYHRFNGTEQSSPGYALRLATNNNVVALSSSAMLVKRPLLQRFLASQCEFHSQAALDLALSSTIIAQDLRVVFSPYAVLKFQRHPPASFTVLSEHDLAALRTHGASLHDPFYPDGLNKQEADYTVTV